MYSGESKYSIFDVISYMEQIPDPLGDPLEYRSPRSGKRKIRQASFQRIDISDKGFSNKLTNKGGSFSSIQDDCYVSHSNVRNIYCSGCEGECKKRLSKGEVRRKDT
jgi:hypothetical protein